MAPVFVHEGNEAWALKALRESGVAVRRVHRVYQPQDALDGNASEVLYESKGRAYTALIEPSGKTLVTRIGW